MKLEIAIGVLFALPGLGVRLQAVAEGVQGLATEAK